MKTIVLTVTRGSLAYNLLHNDFFRILREEHHIIILTSAYQDTRFLEEFEHNNVEFLPFEERNQGPLERFLFFFHKHLIYNSTVNQKARWGIIGDSRSKHSSFMMYCIKRGIFIVLSKLRFLRDFVRLLDKIFTQKDEVRMFRGLLQEQKADCVISTSLSGDSEMALIKAAQDLNIPSIGFPKSWDSLSKHGFRAKPNHLAVWNDFTKEQAMRFQNYRADKITVVGVPQFDRYVKKDAILDRAAFCALYGLDPARKIIMFGSEGKLFPSDATIAKIVARLIDDNVCGMPSQLLIRPHYGYKDDEKKFTECIDKPHVVVDHFNRPSENLRDKWDYSTAFADRFTNCLYHADVVINTASTLTLDAICFDKPVINIAFDGEMPLPYEQSIERWYETYYYRRILSYGATYYVKNTDELTVGIRECLLNPSVKSGERKKLRNDFCYRLDGKAGERFASAIESILVQ